MFKVNNKNNITPFHIVPTVDSMLAGYYYFNTLCAGNLMSSFKRI